MVGSQRLMTRQRFASPSCQEGESVVKEADDLLDREGPGSHRSELDREGQTVEASAHLNDRSLVEGGELERA